MTSKITGRRVSRTVEARQKIRKVGELIRLSRKTKAVTDLDARKGIPIASVRKEIHDWAKNSKK